MRKRSEPHTFEQRLEQHKLRLEREASQSPDREQREDIARRIEQLQHAADINNWLKRGNAGSLKRGAAGA